MPKVTKREILDDNREIWTNFLLTVYRTSVFNVFGSVATIADADLTMAGATYRGEDVFGKDSYNRGDDTLTWVGRRVEVTSFPSTAPASGSLLIRATVRLDAADLNALHATALLTDDIAKSADAQGKKACLEFSNGSEEYLSREHIIIDL